VEHLLQCSANVLARDDGGLIPLHNACSFGHADVVQLLLQHGADANARDNWNYSPLHEAAIKGKIDVCIGRLFFVFCLMLNLQLWVYNWFITNLNLQFHVYAVRVSVRVQLINSSEEDNHSVSDILFCRYFFQFICL